MKTFVPALTLLLTFALGGIASAQTPTTTPPTPAPMADEVPSAPNTGSGGDMPQNIALLGISGMAALLGAAYVVSLRKSRRG